MQPHEFFRALLDFRGTNPNAVATAIGKPTLQGTLSKFASGKTRNPRSEWVIPVAKLLQVPTEALRTEEAATACATQLGIGGGAIFAREEAVRPLMHRAQARIDAGALALQIADLMRGYDEAVRNAAAQLFAAAASRPDEAPALAQSLRGLLNATPGKRAAAA